MKTRIHIPPRYRKGPRNRGVWKRPAGLVAALFLLWCLAAELGLRQVSPALVEEAARGYLLSAINTAVEAELNGEELSFASLSDSSVTVDSVALTRLKARVLNRLEKSLNGSAAVRIPMGSLLPLRLWNGRGPGVPLKLRLESSADISFDTEFATAGWDQSCHRVVMTVRAQCYSQSRSFETELAVETSAVVAETVLIGERPQAVLAGNNGS